MRKVLAIQDDGVSIKYEDNGNTLRKVERMESITNGTITIKVGDTVVMNDGRELVVEEISRRHCIPIDHR